MATAKRKFVGPAMYVIIGHFMVAIHFWVSSSVYMQF